VTPGAVHAVNQVNGTVGEQIGTLSWSGGVTPVASPTAEPSSVAPSGSPSGLPSGSPSSAVPSAPPSPSQPTPAGPAKPVTVPSYRGVWLRQQSAAPNAKYLQIENLTQALMPGHTVEIEFTITVGGKPVPGGPVQLIVPIGPPDQSTPAPRVTLAPAPTS